MPYFGGLDWGAAGHAVCVVDETGAVLLSLGIRHDAAGLAELRSVERRAIRSPFPG